MDVNVGMRSIDFIEAARRLGMLSAVGVVVLGAAGSLFFGLRGRVSCRDGAADDRLLALETRCDRFAACSVLDTGSYRP
jgi:hypothetical protein